MLKKVFYGLRGKILRYILLSSLIPLFLSIVFLYVAARSSLLSITSQTMTNSIHNIKRLCEIQSQEMDAKAQRDLKNAFEVARGFMAPYGSLDITKKTEDLMVINQDTGERSSVKLPTMNSRGTSFLKNYGLIDRIAARIAIPNATATIFQLHEDKLIRISTNVKNDKGERAILTYIPKSSLVFRTLTAGKRYNGRAMVVGKWFITAYEPLKDTGGKVIGAYYIGIPAPKTVVFDIIRETHVGRHGYIYVINSQGQMIEHPFLKGKMVLEDKDALTGRQFFKDMLQKEGDTIPDGHINYHYRGKDGDIEKKVAYYTYFKPWDWIIVSTADYDDILGSLNIIFYIMVTLLVVFMGGLIFYSNYLAGKIANPFRRIIDTAVKVSNGDLKVFIPQSHYVMCAQEKDCKRIDCPAHNNRNKACWRIEGTLCADGNIDVSKVSKEERCQKCIVYKKAIRDEIDALIEAFNNMIQVIRRIVQDITQMTTSLNSEADELAVISSKMEIEFQNQAASIEETTSANEELMASIENVANSADRQAERVSQTSAAMEELAASTKIVGENSINSSKKAKETVEDARNTETVLQNTTKSINQISDSSRKIVDIVAIINDISDQINLLALNAAIEAARAGDHGKGFAVVSEEISKLAEATAQSTKEIEGLIKTSRSDIETGASLVNQTASSITSMIKNIEDAARLIEEIALSSEEQIRGSEQVMKDVEEINNMSSLIASATGEQKSTSSEILKAVSKINESIQELANSAQIVASSASSMKNRSVSLQKVINIFRV